MIPNVGADHVRHSKTPGVLHEMRQRRTFANDKRACARYQREIAHFSSVNQQCVPWLELIFAGQPQADAFSWHSPYESVSPWISAMT